MCCDCSDFKPGSGAGALSHRLSSAVTAGHLWWQAPEASSQSNSSGPAGKITTRFLAFAHRESQASTVSCREDCQDRGGRSMPEFSCIVCSGIRDHSSSIVGQGSYSGCHSTTFGRRFLVHSVGCGYCGDQCGSCQPRICPCASMHPAKAGGAVHKLLHTLAL